MTEEDPLTRTGTLKKEFGDNWRTWSWFAKQWSTLSLATLGGLALVLLGVLAWAWTLSTHVTTLETRVEPVLNEGKQEAQNALQIVNLDKRVGRIEGVIDLDYAEQMKEWAQAARYARSHGLAPPPQPRPKRDR